MFTAQGMALRKARMKPPHEVGLSLPINVNFARQSCNLKPKVAVTKVPRATVGSLRSSRQSVSRLTKRRAAMSLVEIMTIVSCIADINSINVLFI